MAEDMMKSGDEDVATRIGVLLREDSPDAVRFRQWATRALREYIQKGFVLNDEILKNGRLWGEDYFDELLERIQEICLSGRKPHQKIADVFEQCSYDYDKNSEATKTFYALLLETLQNESERQRLDALATAYIDDAEQAAVSRQPMSMNDWLRKMTGGESK